MQGMHLIRVTPTKTSNIFGEMVALVRGFASVTAKTTRSHLTLGSQNQHLLVSLNRDLDRVVLDIFAPAYLMSRCAYARDRMAVSGIYVFSQCN